MLSHWSLEQQMSLPGLTSILAPVHHMLHTEGLAGQLDRQNLSQGLQPSMSTSGAVSARPYICTSCISPCTRPL